MKKKSQAVLLAILVMCGCSQNTPEVSETYMKPPTSITAVEELEETTPAAVEEVKTDQEQTTDVKHNIDTINPSLKTTDISIQNKSSEEILNTIIGLCIVNNEEELEQNRFGDIDDAYYTRNRGFGESENLWTFSQGWNPNFAKDPKLEEEFRGALNAINSIQMSIATSSQESTNDYIDTNENFVLFKICLEDEEIAELLYDKIIEFYKSLPVNPEIEYELYNYSYKEQETEGTNEHGTYRECEISSITQGYLKAKIYTYEYSFQEGEPSPYYVLDFSMPVFIIYE